MFDGRGQPRDRLKWQKFCLLLLEYGQWSKDGEGGRVQRYRDLSRQVGGFGDRSDEVDECEDPGWGEDG